MARLRGFTDRTCIVCGHNLGPYGRICDKCGSIQRPVGGDGLPLPPDKFKACERCGNPIPVESMEDLCEQCLTGEEIPQVVWVEDVDPHRKAKLAAKISSGITIAAGVGLALVMIFVGTNILIDVLEVVVAFGIGASVASWVAISRRPAHKIEYYPPIKPERRENTGG